MNPAYLPPQPFNNPPANGFPPPRDGGVAVSKSMPPPVSGPSPGPTGYQLGPKLAQYAVGNGQSYQPYLGQDGASTHVRPMPPQGFGGGGPQQFNVEGAGLPPYSSTQPLIAPPQLQQPQNSLQQHPTPPLQKPPTSLQQQQPPTSLQLQHPSASIQQHLPPPSQQQQQQPPTSVQLKHASAPMQQHLPPPSQQQQQIPASVQLQHSSSPPLQHPPTSFQQQQPQSIQQHLPPLSQQQQQQQQPPTILQQPMMPPLPQQPPYFPPMPQQSPHLPPPQHPPMPQQPPMMPLSRQLPPQMGQPLNPQMMNQPRMPPLPGQMMNNPDQLSNQMRNMNVSGPPHMLPPQNSMQQQQQRQPPTGYPAAPGGYAPKQAPRLDPDQMPSPIQVMEDDRRLRSDVFVTNQIGLVPPLVTTNFVVEDQGNTNPRFIRSTMYNIPISQDAMKQTMLPFSLVLSPMARLVKGEYPPPIVNFGDLGPVRCIRCKAYMCPYMQFIDAGRRFQCLFCKATTDVPAEYFQHLDHTGQRTDKYQRPELVLGTYEFVATPDYCNNKTLPKPPAIVFVIDVSYNNIKSGLVNLMCAEMKRILKNLPVDQGQTKSNMKVGFITYNSSVHFYNIKGSLAAPQMMIVGDIQEMFMPLLDGFLSTVEESEMVIDTLMEQIPQMFAGTKETEIVLLPAITAGVEALKVSGTNGKLMVFHSTLPTAECPGKLKNRDDRNVLGTDKEKTVLQPQIQSYNVLGQECVAAGCSVDLFIFNNSFIDLATIAQVSRLSGGEVFKYTYFQSDVDGERLIDDIILNISRPIGFDAVMRVRTSTGVRPTDVYGYFYMSNTTDIELGSLDCDKGIAVEIKHDDKLNEQDGVYIQAALLYTSCSGQRRIRIMNLALKTCSQMADLYKSCDLDTLINFYAKQATFKILDGNPKVIKDTLVSRTAQILASYRKHCASPGNSVGQLILPECMKLLPLYINCLLKNDALSGGSDMTIDDRAFAMQVVLTLDVPSSVYYFYPRLIALHEIDLTNPEKVPPLVRCTYQKLSEQGIYLLENGVYMFLWIGLGASPELVQNLFGAATAMQIDIEHPHLPELDNQFSHTVRDLIHHLRVERHRHMRLTIVRQREKLEHVFKHFLVEDRGNDGSASYVDFLCHIHKEIRNLQS